MAHLMSFGFWAIAALSSAETSHTPLSSHIARRPIQQPLATAPNIRRSRPQTRVLTLHVPLPDGTHLVKSGGRADGHVFDGIFRRRTQVRAGGVSQEAGLVAEESPKWRRWLILFALVVHKTLVDQITDITRKNTVYSEGAVSLLAEVAKLPVLAVSIILFTGSGSLLPTFRKGIDGIKSVASHRLSVHHPETALMWISLLYGIQNLLYFNALSNLSAAAYQALSQTKTVFTAMFMVSILGKRLSVKQWGALGLLIAGMLVVQSQEVSTAAAVGGNALLGGFFVVISSLLSALPNVYYEKILKLPQADMWVQNIQITWWIFFWLVVNVTAKAVVIGEGIPCLSVMTQTVTGLSPWVWAIVVLKSLNGVLIPLTLKYTDNILYSYAKPTSIAATCVGNAIITQTPPTPAFAGGIAAVIISILMYNS